jgi:serine protease Do
MPSRPRALARPRVDLGPGAERLRELAKRSSATARAPRRDSGALARITQALAACLVAFCATALSLPSGAAASTESRRTPLVVAVERASPAVVNVAAEQVVVVRRDPFFDQFFEEFFRMQPRPQQYKRTSLGSGVIVREDGYVVTNAHVVAEVDKVRVVLADEREFEARVVGTDTEADLAVLQIDGRNLPHVTFGRTDDLMIGETVIAIGNPFGFSHTVTTGVVSATGRALPAPERSYVDFIQTDASINPGNSGGPLLNIDGELIGINTAIYGRAQGIGFAIPAERARRVVDDLIQFGAVHRGYLGLEVQDLTPELASALGADVQRGVVVRSVDARGPAAAAGLVAGDVIVRFDGREIKNRSDFDERAAALTDDDAVRLEVVSAAGRREVELVAAELTGDLVDETAWRRIGLKVARVQRGPGVAVTDVRRASAAARAGFRRGDLVLTIGGAEIRSPDDFRKAVRKARGVREIALEAARGRARYRLSLPLEE